MERLDIYKKPRCVQCDATERALGKFGLKGGVDYATHDLTADNEMLEAVKKFGFEQAPVVVESDVDPETGETLEILNVYSGFRPDEVKKAGAALIARTPELEVLSITPQEFHARTQAPHLQYVAA